MTLLLGAIGASLSLIALASLSTNGGFWDSLAKGAAVAIPVLALTWVVSSIGNRYT